MKVLKKLLARIRRLPEEDDWEAAKHEAQRIQDRNLDVRLSQRSAAGEWYESDRGMDGRH
jgi:hypothetical protein